VTELRGAVVRWGFRCFCSILVALGRLLYKLEIQGWQHFPANGPAILTCRHNSGLDVLVAALGFTTVKTGAGPPPVGVTGVITVNRFRAWLGRILGMIPLFREQGLSSISLLTLHKALQQGSIVTIADNEIPWDGRLRVPLSGVAWCALRTHAPVVVAVLNGGYRVAPRWAQRIPLRGKLVLRFGAPFYLGDAPHRRVTNEMLEQANLRLMEEIQTLSDPGLIDERYPRCKGIPSLLWQCPLCHADEALRHQTSWFRPAAVECHHCGTVWVVERYRDDDYHLKVARGNPAVLGQERPLAAWYASMKDGLRLTGQEDPAVILDAGEELYVRSGEAWLELEQDNPLLDRWDGEDAPSQPAGDLGLMKEWDRGRLFLTSDRFIWRGNRRRLTFRLTTVRSAHIHTVRFFGFLYGLRRYRFRFREDRLLKWLTSTALVAQRIERVSGHRISTTNY
jgi:1-acyl-sn-glycerol-3-phosphate acyltransferase